MLESLKYAATSVSLSGGEIFLIVLLGIIGLVLLFLFAEVIGKALILKKAGESWWAAFIPVYSSCMLCKISGTNYLWVVIKVVCNLLFMVESEFFTLYLIAMLMYSYVISCNLCHSFKKDNGFLVGLLFLPYIFYFVLGLTKSEYVGPIGDGDPILKNVEFGSTKIKRNIEKETIDKINKYNSVEEKRNDNYKYCYGCGYKLSEYDRFCPGCGREI